MGWRESDDISLAGVVAARVFATAGAGGIALTVWELDRSGVAGGSSAFGEPPPGGVLVIVSGTLGNLCRCRAAWAAWSGAFVAVAAVRG